MLRNLRLDRPLAAIDCETTGLLEHDPHIVELAVVRIEPDLSAQAMVWRLDPGCPIPALATAVHGITDAAVYKCPRFEEVMHEISPLLFGADLTGFNVVRFDLPVIDLERGRAGYGPVNQQGRAVIDSMVLFHRYYPPPRDVRGQGTLAAACRKYLGGEPLGAHGALWDALTALHVLDAQVARHCLPGHPGAILDVLAARVPLLDPPNGPPVEAPT
jgi:DNA polymerase-3 subunit epsilon